MPLIQKTCRKNLHSAAPLQEIENSTSRSSDYTSEQPQSDDMLLAISSFILYKENYEKALGDLNELKKGIAKELEEHGKKNI